jgi:hypothetical protein
MLDGDLRLGESILEDGLEVADLREGEVSLSDLWLRCRRRAPQAGADPEVPPAYDFRLHG